MPSENDYHIGTRICHYDEIEDATSTCIRYDIKSAVGAPCSMRRYTEFLNLHEQLKDTKLHFGIPVSGVQV